MAKMPPGTLLLDLPKMLITRMLAWEIECLPSGKDKATTTTRPAAKVATKPM